MSNNQIEQGKAFTDDVYATKEEVKARYNQDNIDGIWKNILFFRSFYDVETELRDASSLPYKICLTKSLTNKAYVFQTKLLNDLMKYILLSDSLKKEFEKNCEISSLNILAMKNEISASRNTLSKVVDEEIENIPTSLFSIKAYHDAYQYLKKTDGLTLEVIEKTNALLSGDSSDKPSIHYRTSQKKDILNTLEEIDGDKIKEHMSTLLSFLSQEEIPVILKTLSIPYFFLSVKPFEYCNEETAALIMKSYLSSQGYSIMGFSLDFESICFTSSKAFFERLKTVEKSLDLTYCLDHFLAYEIHSEEAIAEVLRELSITKIQEEVTNTDNTSYPNDIKVIESEKNYALPNFPTKDSSETIEARARQLREMHPQLKKKQAHFYAGHCTIGLNYTIEQFKKEESTVYETARTSMEDLANRGFYQKLQIGKKFVYTPIPVGQKNEVKDEIQFSDDVMSGE